MVDESFQNQEKEGDELIASEIVKHLLFENDSFD